MWLDLNQYLKIYIPFQQRTVSRGAVRDVYGRAIPNSGSAELQFLYNGQWYSVQNLLRVWNPIRSLPSWAR